MTTLPKLTDATLTPAQDPPWRLEEPAKLRAERAGHVADVLGGVEHRGRGPQPLARVAPEVQDLGPRADWRFTWDPADRQ